MIQYADSSEVIIETGFMAQFLLDDLFSLKQSADNNIYDLELLNPQSDQRKEFIRFQGGIKLSDLIQMYNHREKFKKLSPSKRAHF